MFFHNWLLLHRRNATRWFLLFEALFAHASRKVILDVLQRLALRFGQEEVNEYRGNERDAAVHDEAAMLLDDVR